MAALTGGGKHILEQIIDFFKVYGPVLFITFTFSRCFYPKWLTNEDNGSNQNKIKSKDMQVL